MKRDEMIELKREFYKKRAIEDKSFDVISQETGVSKPTLIKWERSAKTAINEIRSSEIQNLISTYSYCLKARLEKLIKVSKKIEAELLERDLSTTPTNKLTEMLLVLNDRISEIESNYSLGGNKYDLEIDRNEYFTES